ncbi:transposase [Bradyrhizobium barranii]|uniref:transposase n=1 Tax=Bradyrhizobium barranii TaxID=2992140 RepID=UPI0024B240C0|nr:transposase [Bradyrhizobium barranii]WFT97071.1 transposase [Bradyrhizobium barranii]
MLAQVEKRWPGDLNARIAAESLEPGAIVTDVARRQGGRRQQVHDWRRRARLGQLVLPASANTLSFCAFGVGIVATGGYGVLVSLRLASSRLVPTRRL